MENECGKWMENNLLWRLHYLQPKSVLVTIYKTFVRFQCDYGHIVHNQAYTMSFHQNLESIKYSNCLAITDVIQCTSKENLYLELVLESL